MDINKEFSCSIIQINNGKNVDDTVKYIENLVKFLEPNMVVKFTEMVCDFIKDESDIWWMVRIVAFKTDPPRIQPILNQFVENFEFTTDSRARLRQKKKINYNKVRLC